MLGLGLLSSTTAAPLVAATDAAISKAVLGAHCPEVRERVDAVAVILFSRRPELLLQCSNGEHASPATGAFPYNP